MMTTKRELGSRVVVIFTSVGMTRGQGIVRVVVIVVVVVIAILLATFI